MGLSPQYPEPKESTKGPTKRKALRDNIEAKNNKQALRTPTREQARNPPPQAAPRFF
jgi:hypothetical protein